MKFLRDLFQNDRKASEARFRPRSQNKIFKKILFLLIPWFWGRVVPSFSIPVRDRAAPNVKEKLSFGILASSVQAARGG